MVLNSFVKQTLADKPAANLDKLSIEVTHHINSTFLDMSTHVNYLQNILSLEGTKKVNGGRF